MAGRKREIPTPELRCPRCAAEVQRFWANCSNCGRRLEWRDTTKETGAECYYCGWVVSDSFSFCPWCGRDIADRDSSPEPLKAPKGFKYHRRCQWGCGGGVMYPGGGYGSSWSSAVSRIGTTGCSCGRAFPA